MAAEDDGVAPAEDEPDTASESGSSSVTAPLQTLPSDGFQPPDSPIADARANAEAVAIGSGEDLEKQARLREHNRHQFFHDWLNRGVTWVMSAVLVSLLFGVCVLAWHLMTPVGWHWLTDAQLETIKTLLGTAIFSSALTGYVTKRMS